MKSTLLEPFDSKILGKLKNRVAMSAMSRSFADKNRDCTPQMAEYYARRAKDGVALILTEGAIIHPSGDGYNNAPHMCLGHHAESWKAATAKVHDAQTRIFCQLWHCGRISHEDYTGGLQPVSSTDRAADGINRQNGKPYAVPRRLDADEMQGIYHQFLHSGKLAIAAGFDGVELHFGHGYLVDQFLDSRVNDRTDKYGGSVENRCRFALELAELAVKEFGANRVMVRISPSRDMNGTYDWPDLERMLACLIKGFDSAGLRMLDVSCARADYFQTSGRIIRNVREMWPHLLIGGASLTLEEAEKEIAGGYLDMVTWGRLLIANPDFVTRLKNNEPLKPYDRQMLSVLH